jgi:hypothetical protein
VDEDLDDEEWTNAGSKKIKLVIGEKSISKHRMIKINNQINHFIR